MRFYDLTAVFSPDLPLYANDPSVEITAHYSLSKGQLCNLSRLSFGSHSGTHADTPRHFLSGGADCETIPLDHFYGPAKVLDLRRILNGRKTVEAADLEAYNLSAGDIVLLNTGNSHLMREKAFNCDYVHLSGEAAQYLADKKIKTVGIDYLSVEAYGNTDFPAHKALLGSGTAILEGLVFDNNPESSFHVPQGDYRLSALPLKIKDGDGSPVRAVLIDERSPELVIFDMDGLMLDTEPISSAGWVKAGKSLGYTFTPELFAWICGTGVSVCRRRLADWFGPEFDFDAAYAARTAYTRAYVDEHGVEVKPGLFTLLDTLDRLGIRKCVATSTELKRAKHLLSLHGLVERFDAIIGGDTVKHGKPDPEIFLTAAAAVSVDPAHCIVLEDSATGAEAAYRGGMRTVLVPDIAQPNKKTLAQVSVVCNDLSEAASFIASL